MSITDYTKAQKMAEKQCRQDIQDDRYPYLPVLEDLLRGADDGRVPLGQIEIPISLIKGTASTERTNAFASNFMPLLETDTEFCAKWSVLCDSVREEGVREPITVLEYLQRFYVVEGNKRVSVSKFNGAVAIEANVTRVIPKPSDSDGYIVYTEFMEFYAVSRIYEIMMKEPGEFRRLMLAIPADEEQGKLTVWSEDLRRDVKFLYSVFERIYFDKNGQRLPIKPGQAFLHFLEIYSFEALRGDTSAELRRKIDRVWGEFRVLADANPISRILDPTEGSKKVAALNRFIPRQNSVLKAAFLYPRDPQGSVWAYNHELGRLHVEETFGSAVSTKAYLAPAAKADLTIETLIADGYKLFFTTSPVYHAVSMREAVAHPDIILMNCSMNTTYKQLRTYYLRIYEAKFIAGMIAGSMTETERIGYIADYPVLGTPASINAFALGVKMVNPRAVVFLDWTTLPDHDPVKYLESKRVDLFSDRDINTQMNNDDRVGLYGTFGGEVFRLAAPIWNWGKLYEEMVHSVLIGAYKNDGNDNETHALNYYWGMSSGAIDVKYSDKLPVGTQRLVHLMKAQLSGGWFRPFKGMLYDQNGNVVCKKGQILSPEEIINISWLADNVFGRLPDVSELKEEFRPFAEQHRLPKAPEKNVEEP
ncbi:MAG: BMP family ABC transporter substrate-binding protein [Oscillospiraceae bacterium]|nr:BMP family ABC transporter substrate-binding protein [Oscillospiraceae bacterium]